MLYSFPFAVFLFINLVAFLILWNDKIRARQNKRERISEGLLFFLAIIGGSVGVFLGMFFFRHKTRVWYFLLGIPLSFVQNLAFIFLITEWINERA